MPFIRHPWPYPSATSLISNLGRIHVLGRLELARLWLSGPDSRRLAVQLGRLRHWVPDQRIARSLRLTTVEVSLAFDPTGWWPAALRTFAVAFADPLRFCPTCLMEGYHTHLFQLPWWIRCPMHNEDLQSACLRCGGRLAGMALGAEPRRAFHCSVCQRDLVNTGALVDAQRGTKAERWHAIMAAHRAWTTAISEAFLVTPTLTTDYCELTAEHVFGWIHAAGVPWPRDLQPFVVRTTEAPRGLMVQWQRPQSCELRVIELLTRQIAARRTGYVPPDRVFAPCSDLVSRALSSLEKRLHQASSDLNNQIWKSRAHFSQVPKSQPWTSKRVKFEYADTIEMRDRGLRRRKGSMSLERVGGVGGGTRLNMHRSDLVGLSAVRLLSLVDDWLKSIAGMPSSHLAKTLGQWWHSHLLALSLVDATIASIHAGSWIPSRESGTELPGWPPVHLDRHTPGHGWLLAATHHNSQVKAYIAAVPLSRNMRPDVERMRELQAIMGSEMLAFQMLNPHPSPVISQIPQLQTFASPIGSIQLPS